MFKNLRFYLSKKLFRLDSPKSEELGGAPLTGARGETLYS